MVEGGTSGSGVQWGSSTSSHSSSSSSSSKGRDTRLLIRVPSSIPSDRIHTFFDRSLTMAKPPIGSGFVKKVSRKSDDVVIVSIEDASIARRLVSLYSEGRPKIDGKEFTIELYKPENSKSLSSPSNHNGDKRREKESTRMSSCSSLPSPSTSKRTSYSSPSTSRPSTSTHDTTKNECVPSSSSSSSRVIPMDPYKGIVGATIKRLPQFGESVLKEMIHEGLRESIGGYLIHFNEDSGRAKVLLKRYSQVEEIPSEGSLLMQGEQATFTVLPTEETRKLYDRYISSDKCRDSMPSTSSCPSPSHPPSTGHRDAMSYNSSRTVFVPCLRKGTTREGLRRRMERIGAVLEVEMKNEQSVAPHAIVEFAHTQGAVMAMEDCDRIQREDIHDDRRSRKSAHFVSSACSLRVWVANLPPQDEDYVKKKLQDLLKGSQNPTIVVDSRRREGIIDFTTLEKAKHYLEIIKSSPLVQQSGSVQTWLVADYCSDLLYDHFIQRRSQGPSEQEKEFMNTLSKMLPNPDQREHAEARMKRMKGGEEKAIEKKRSVNGENGNHSHSPSSSRRLNGEDRRSGDSGFSEDREKAQALDSDDDEMLERKWRTLAPANDRREENGVMRRRITRLGDDLVGFIQHVPQGTKIVKKEIKEEDDVEKKENEKIPREQRVNGFREALLNVGTPLKARGIDDIMRYRGKDPLKSPPIPISPFNGDKEKKHIVSSPPSGSRPAPLHISIPQSSSTHSNPLHSPYSRVPPSSSASSSRHPSISTPSTLTPRSHTLPSSVPRPHANEPNGDHVWSSGGTGGAGSTVGTPTSSRVPLSRRESVCSNSSQSTPLPPVTPSTSGTTATVYTPNALKSPPVNSWSSTSNVWKGGPSLSSPNPSSINRSRPSLDHKSSTPSSHSRPPLALPKSSMDKSGFPSSSLPKTPSLPRSSSMNEKKPIISRESSKDIVNNIIQNKSGHLKNMVRIPKKDNREREEKEERREKKREEKDRERREDREERKEKKEDRKKSRENETKEEKARRRELKRKERDKDDRKKSSTDKDKKRKSIDNEKKKKKKHSKTRSDSEDSEIDYDPSSSRQIDSDAALARQLAYGGSMYDRVKGRRSGGGKEEKKSAALETLRMKNKKKNSKKRVHLSSSSDSDGEVKESGKKMKREEDDSSEDEEERERRKKEKKREKERRETTDESDSDEEIHKKKKKEKKVSKKNSTLDLFSDDADSVKSVKSERKEPLSKKRSHDKEMKDKSPSPSPSHPPPGKKVKKEESSSSQSESEDEAERSSKKSEVSTSSWRAGEDKSRRLSESSVATHSEKDEAWKSPSSGSVEKEMKEEPKEDRPVHRLMTKAAMKEFNVCASSSPAGSSWMNNKDDTGLNLSSDSSQSSSDSDEEKEEIEERKAEEREGEGETRKESEDVREEEEEEKMEEENVEMKEEEMIEETKEEEIMEEEKEEEVKMEVEESQPMEKDEEAESAVRGLESPCDDAIEETEKAVESIFDEEEEPEARYPSNDFLNAHDMIISSSSSQCSSPKIVPSSSSSLPHRPTPLHPSIISSPSILSPSPLHHHLLQSHSIPPPVSSPLISSPLISPSTSRPASIHLNVRPISQESSSQHVHDDNGVGIHQEKSWTSQGSSSDGPSPSPNHHTMMNKEEILKKFPTKWSGLMKMKASEMQTSWFKLHGDDSLLNSVLPNGLQKIEVRGKMRMNNEKVGQLTSSMDCGEDHACLIVTPAGHDSDEVIRNRDLFSRSLVGYFQTKDIAGITELPSMEGHTYIGHCFAPGQFVRDYLVPLYPDFHDLLQRKYANAFLLVILKRRDDE